MIRQTLIALVIVTFLFCPEGNAEEVDSGLEAARKGYQQSLTNARNDLLTQLKKKAEDAERARKGDVARKLRTEMEALEKNQRLPTLISVKGYEAEQRKAALKLETAYKAAIKGFTQAGKKADAKRVQQALDELKRKEAIQLTPLLGKELLRNPGAEDAWVAGVLPGWTSSQVPWGIRKADPAPANGESYFAPTPSPIAEIFQDVSLVPFTRVGATATLEARFRCSVRSFLQLSPDTTQVILEFRDGNRRVLEFWDSGKVSSIHVWTELAETHPIPPKAKWIRVRLISTRSGGLDNDGYFDDVSLKVTAKGNNRLFDAIW